MSIKKHFLIIIFLPMMIYPVYFIWVNAIDSLFGDQQLIYWLLFDSHYLLFTVTIGDWVHSLPIMYSLYIFVILPLYFILNFYKKYSFITLCLTCSFVILLTSLYLDFEGNGLVSNTLTMLTYTALFYGLSIFKKNINEKL